MQKPPAFLYFDLGNVVLTFDYQTAVRQMSTVAGLPESVVREVVFDSGLQDEYERGVLTTAEFYEAFCQRTGKRPGLAPLLVASSDMFQLDTAVADLILALRRSGYRIGVLSNTCEAHWQFCRNRRFPILAQFFQVTALSYELRSMKPEPAIYAAAARLAGVEPAEVFFVDDRAEHVAGARQAGFDAVLFTGAVALRDALTARGVRGC